MVEIPYYVKINTYPQLDNEMQFRRNKTNKIKEKFIAEVCERETMSKIICECSATFEFFDKTLLVLSVASSNLLLHLVLPLVL